MSMESRFAKQARGVIPLPEHPRPQCRRDDYLCLNGEWDFSMDQKKGYVSSYSRKIVVPFAVETSMSGVQSPVKKTDVLHYRKTFSHPLPKGKRALLHFDAMDQICRVYFNGVFLGEHEGGYLPFSFDVSEFYREENEIYVEVTDDTDSPIYPRGKQSNSREESGIPRRAEFTKAFGWNSFPRTMSRPSICSQASRALR